MKKKNDVWNALSEYKIKQLKVTQNGTYLDRTYDHILPKELERLNVVESYRTDFYEEYGEKMKFHKNFNHLNSSQAVAINFFYPLMKEGKFDVLLNALNIENEKVIDHGFEKVINTKEGTRFDFYLKLDSGRQIFFELKYTEKSYGMAKADFSHIKTYRNIYSKKIQTYIKRDYCTKEEMFKHYQLFRCAMSLNVEKGDQLVIIYPTWNNSAAKKASLFYDNMIVDSLKDHVKLIRWEDLIKNIESYLNANKGDVLAQPIKAFKDKYLNVAY